MTLKKLENSVSHLSAKQLVQFREWFLEFDAKNEDGQIDVRHW